MILMQNSPDELTANANTTSTARRVHYGIWILVAGIFTIFGSIGLGRFAIGMIIPEMGAGLGLTNTQLGIIVSGTFVGYLVSTAVSGELATRFGPRRVIAAAMFLISFGMVIAGIAHGFWPALAGQLLIGTGTGGSNVPAMGLITRWYSKKFRGTASGLMAMGSGLGFALAGTLVPFLVGLYGGAGWRMSWFYLGSLVFMIAVLGAVVFKNTPDEIGIEPIGGIEDIDGATSSSPRKAGKEGSAHWKDIYFSKPLWELGLIYFMFGFSYVIFTTFFAKYLVEEIGFSHSMAGQLWSVVGVVSIASGFLWGLLSDRIGRKSTLFIVYSLQGLCLLTLALVHAPNSIVLASLIYALTLWSIPAIMAATCADYVGGKFAPAAFGMITLFFGAGQAISPWVSGYILDLTHSFAIPFLVSAGAGIVGAILLLALPKRA